MATKTPVDGTAHINYILSSLSHAEGEFKIDWNEVAKSNGIGYGRNASTKFKDTLKKYGYKFESNTITKIDGTAPATPSTAGAATPKAKAKKPTSANGTVAKDQAKGIRFRLPQTVKKRKLDAKDSRESSNDEGDEGSARIKVKNEDNDARGDGGTEEETVKKEDDSDGNDEDDEVVD